MGEGGGEEEEDADLALARALQAQYNEEEEEEEEFGYGTSDSEGDFRPGGAKRKRKKKKKKAVAPAPPPPPKEPKPKKEPKPVIVKEPKPPAPPKDPNRKKPQKSVYDGVDLKLLISLKLLKFGEKRIAHAHPLNGEEENKLVADLLEDGTIQLNANYDGNNAEAKNFKSAASFSMFVKKLTNPAISIARIIDADNPTLTRKVIFSGIQHPAVRTEAAMTVEAPARHILNPVYLLAGRDIRHHGILAGAARKLHDLIGMGADRRGMPACG